MITGSILPSQIFSFLNLLLGIYYYLIIARLILSWFVNSHTLEHNIVGYWLCLLTDPFLRLFRRLPFSVIGGIVDISPIFALFAISLLQRFLRTLSVTQSAPFGLVFFGLLFQLLHVIILAARTITIICALILFFRLLHALFSKPSSYNTALGHIDFYIRKLFQGPLRFLNIQSSAFTTQITALLIIVSLLTWLLGLLNGLLLSL